MDMRSLHCIFALLLIAHAKSEEPNLELVQVLFRHGDRTPDLSEIPDHNPYSSNIEEYGYGQLTKKGMQRMYEFGQMLRSRYENFIGDDDISKVYPYSTQKDRTRASLQLTLAGLFSVTNKTSWNNQMRWLPIPINYELDESNFLMKIYSHHNNCGKKFWKLFYNTLDSLEMQKKLSDHKAFLDSLAEKIGRLSPWALFNYLRAMESMELELPNWCSHQDYHKIKNVTDILSEALTKDSWSKRMTAGSFLKKFLQNFDDSNSTKKMYLYSANDLQIMSISQVLQFANVPKTPDYGSALIFEKFRRSSVEMIRMFMWMGVAREMVPIKLLECDHECPLETYTSAVKKFFPTDEDEKCE